MPPVATPKSKKTPAPKQVLIVPAKNVRVYATPVLLSAFLLFLVQPMLAKAILPWFGGTASVWIVAMLFFQGMLVFGYGYAYLLNRFLPAKLQAIGHALLLFASLAVMPIAPWRVWHGAEGDPSIQILRVLFLTVGLPYFLLSTTGPLIQSWYARAQRVALPYRLFALSNLGSLVALLAYPVIIEPFLTTRHQMIAWSVLYGSFVLLAGVTATHFWRSRPQEPVATAPDSNQIAAPERSSYLLWGALAACGSALLVTVMNHLCQNVAPIPLLWVLPLATYLLTFILCFDRQGWYKPGLLRWLLPLALGAMMYGVFNPSKLPGAAMQIAIYLVCLFVGCMFCHGELARRKPHSRYLTAYYLMISLGGALASLAIGLIAPHVFAWQVEFPLGLVGCAILGLLTLFPKHWLQQAAIAALTVVFGLFTFGVIHEMNARPIVQARNFYGTLNVLEEGGTVAGKPVMLRKLNHGWILHGTEFLGQGLDRFPTTYYGAHTGVGRLLSAARGPWNVGVIGLGAGTLAGYVQPSDHFTFYEINPLVAQVAANQFHYLSTSPSPVNVVIGDGRLSVQKEPSQKFNLLVIDAFSGDSIPAHLLTREAFEMYFSKLKADGVIAVHITNRYINLAPPLAAVAEDLHKQAVLVMNQDKETLGAFSATWMLITADASSLPEMPRNTSRTVERMSGYPAWTDDYSNVFQLLK